MEVSVVLLLPEAPNDQYNNNAKSLPKRFGYELATVNPLNNESTIHGHWCESLYTEVTREWK
jgi:hypothetical protein